MLLANDEESVICDTSNRGQPGHVQDCEQRIAVACKIGNAEITRPVRSPHDESVVGFP